jgi:hypothetical protein
MPQVGFENKVFDRANIVLALNRAVTMIDYLIQELDEEVSCRS